MLKNFSLSNLIKGLIISIIFDLVRISKFMVHGDFSLVSAVLRGNYAFIKGIPKTLAKRKYIQKTRQISDGELGKMGLIASLNWCLKEYERLGK
jgi:ABC-type amino acid transport system permease subunit